MGQPTSFPCVPPSTKKVKPSKSYDNHLIPSFHFFVTSEHVVYKSNRFCCAVGTLRRVSSTAVKSNSAITKAGSWPVVATISPQGLTMVLCPQAW